MRYLPTLLSVIPILASGAGACQYEEAVAAVDFPAERVEAHVATSLVCETDAVQPGQTTWIGVSFKIDAGWHLYWNGRNDSGSPPGFGATLPSGLTLGEWVWPAPVRHRAPGDILDHVYEGTVLLMAPLRIPADAKAGTSVTLKLNVDWVVCDSSMCVPESQAIELTLPIRAAAGSGSNVKEFEQARARHPKPWPTDSKDFTRKDGSGKAGRAVVFHVKGATRLEFYPSATGAEARDIIKEGSIMGDTLRLSLRTGPRGTGELRGVLAVGREGKDPSEFYTIGEAAVVVRDQPVGSTPSTDTRTPGAVKEKN